MQVLHICTTVTCANITKYIKLIAMSTVTAFIRTSKNSDKPVRVRFRLTDGRDVQVFYSSDLYVNPSRWNPVTHSIKSRVAMDEKERYAFNKGVEEMKSKMSCWYASLPNKGLATSERFENYLEGVKEEISEKVLSCENFTGIFEAMLVDKRYKKQREKNMRVLYSDVMRFASYMSTSKGRVYNFDISSVTESDLRAFQRFLEDEYRIVKIYPELYIDKPLPKRRDSAP